MGARRVSADQRKGLLDVPDVEHSRERERDVER